MLMQDWKQVRKAISEAEHILLLPHIHADGDSLGSAFGLAYFLCGQGKTRQYFFGRIASRKSVVSLSFRQASGRRTILRMAARRRVGTAGARFGDRGGYER